MNTRFATVVFAAVTTAVSGSTLPIHASTSLPLQTGWKLQSACKSTEAGSAISRPRFSTAGWISASLPTTVLAAQVTAGEFKDPYFGTNLRSIPGTTYPIGTNFSNLPVPDDSPYHCGWWYRREFAVTAAEKGKSLSLQFDGINYTGEVWVNGTLVADKSKVVGAYRRYEFDISKVVRPGAGNVVAVQVFAPPPQALAINWVDWNPMPPDKDMGLWGEVRLIAHGLVGIQHPAVFTHFTDDSLKRAALTVTADVQNSSDKSVRGTLSGVVAGIPISQPVTLEAGETKTVSFAPGQFPRLIVESPRVWWPAEYGAPQLQTLSLKFVAEGAISDQQSLQFGIREITSELTPQGYRLFKVNGKPILIRGGGWSQDMLLRPSHERLVQQFALVHDLHLNTIRLEGKLEDEDFFHLADQQGILVMAGWCCCDFWEHWKDWTPADLEIAAASLQSQALRLRSHPSVLVWLNGSDNPPPAEVENRYLDVLKQAQWPDPVLSSASQAPTTVTGPSGVKMTGPYDFVAPSYWYQEKNRHGGAYGFNTETSPGPAVPSVGELRRFLPDNALWPPDNATWNYHAGGESFKNLGVFNNAMAATYGAVENAASYNQIAQTMEYDGERAMFEAYSGERYTSTGVIQWMLNNAWPSLIWHLYDYYLVPGAGYYGTKKANEPVHAQYNYVDHGVYLVNSTLKDAEISVTAQVFDFDLHPAFSKDVTVAIGANSSKQILVIPDDALGGAQLHFIRLSTTQPRALKKNINFYWVPAKLTVFDWPKTEFNVTPALTPEVMTDLRKLPQANVTARISQQNGNILLHLENTSKALAFQVHAEVLRKDGAEAPMLMWDDNFIELMPGEERALSTSLPVHQPAGQLTIKITGWNTPAIERTLTKVVR